MMFEPDLFLPAPVPPPPLEENAVVNYKEDGSIKYACDNPGFMEMAGCCISSSPKAPSLRPYQVQAIKDVEAAISLGKKRILMQSPTGSGKTIVACELLRRAVDDGKKVIFLAHRREIIFQCRDKLRDFGIESGIYMAGERRLPLPVQVASIQTLWSRVYRGDGERPQADIIICDEAHHSRAKTWQSVLESYPEAVVLGLTATPIRADGRGLGQLFQTMVRASNIKDLTSEGYLVPVRYYAPSKPDLEGIRIVAGDYSPGQLESRMDRPELVGDVVENWLRIAKERPTVIFASGVKHSLHIRDQFLSVGVQMAHIDGSTPKAERDDILRQLDRGDIRGVVNCMVLTEGWDQPRVSCAVLARPTKNMGLFLQMAGRILRPCPDKVDACIIDHAGAIYAHGPIDEFDAWELTDDSRMLDKWEAKKAKAGRDIICSVCAMVYRGRLECPGCGHRYEIKGKGVEFVDGLLREIVNRVEQPMSHFQLSCSEWYQQLLGYAEQKGYNPGWAAHKYKERFGDWPNGILKIIREPGAEVLAYVNKLNRRWRAKIALEEKNLGLLPPTGVALGGADWR